MNDVFQKKRWKARIAQLHVDPPPTLLIKIKHGDKPDKDFVNIKFLRYQTSENSDLYEFKMVLFDNDEPEEFLLFIRNFNMTLEAAVTLHTAANIQYICMLVSGEALRQFDTLSADVESGTPLKSQDIILGLHA